MTQPLSDQQIITIRLSDDEWERIYEGLAFSEDGKDMADRIRAEVIQPGREGWEMAFTVSEWAYMASEVDDDSHLSEAVGMIDAALAEHGWV
jgi:hypothetical protein